jgi:hypothetical protein
MGQEGGAGLVEKPVWMFAVNDVISVTEPEHGETASFLVYGHTGPEGLLSLHKKQRYGEHYILGKMTSGEVPHDVIKMLDLVVCADGMMLSSPALVLEKVAVLQRRTT